MKIGRSLKAALIALDPLGRDRAEHAGNPETRQCSSIC